MCHPDIGRTCAGSDMSGCRTDRIKRPMGEQSVRLYIDYQLDALIIIYS